MVSFFGSSVQQAWSCMVIVKFSGSVFHLPLLKPFRAQVASIRNGHNGSSQRALSVGASRFASGRCVVGVSARIQPEKHNRPFDKSACAKCSLAVRAALVVHAFTPGLFPCSDTTFPVLVPMRKVASELMLWVWRTFGGLRGTSTSYSIACQHDGLHITTAINCLSGFRNSF